MNAFLARNWPRHHLARRGHLIYCNVAALFLLWLAVCMIFTGFILVYSLFVIVVLTALPFGWAYLMQDLNNRPSRP